MKTIFILLLLALTGCYTPETVCQRYGAVPGTDAYVNCMAQLATGANQNWAITGR